MFQRVFAVSVACVGLMGCELEDIQTTESGPATSSVSTVKVAENGCLMDNIAGNQIPIVDENGRPICR